MKHKNLVVYAIICLALVVFSFTYHRGQVRAVEQAVREHARMAAEPLWNFDNNIMNEYLQVIMDRHHYASIKVLESLGEIFAELTNSEESTLEQTLQTLHFIPRRSTTVPITKKGERIGTLEVTWYDTSIYGIAYGVLIAALLLIIARLYVRVFVTNKKLEGQVTRLREAMAEIKRQKEYIEDVFHVIPLALITDEGDGHYVEQNTFLATIVSGWAERTGLECATVKDQVLARLQQELENHEQGKLIVTLADQPVHLEFSSAEVPSLDAIDRVIALRDITSLVTMEQQISQTQKLEAVGQLAAGIAHEINTPTQYVGSNIEFLDEAFADIKELVDVLIKQLNSAKEKSLCPELISELEEKLDEIDWPYLLEEIPKAIHQSRDGVHRVTSIVRAMKEFSHPGSKDKESLNLNHIINTTVTVARNEWKCVAEVELDLDPDLPQIPLLADEMGQVILNMLVNAAQAIGEKLGQNPAGDKGKITITTRKSENSVELHICDTGQGIPEKARPRIFDPFYTTKKVGKGTGQGLAISHDVIVDKHGGTIHFESEEGKGTHFVITLPLHSPTGEQKLWTATRPKNRW